MNEEVRDHDGLISVESCLSVLVDLGQKGTYLHVSLALILQHFKLERWIGRVVKVVLNILAVYIG